MRRVFIAAVKFYRRYLSRFSHGCCRFIPTCSEYSIEAFSKRGTLAGLYLTVTRILRCNPLCRGGYDPVPERGFKSFTADLEKDRQFLSDKAHGRK